MNASKENARKAIEALAEWKQPSASRTVVAEFLLAAEKRLPSEAAIARDRARRKTTAKK